MIIRSIDLSAPSGPGARPGAYRGAAGRLDCSRGCRRGQASHRRFRFYQGQNLLVHHCSGHKLVGTDHEPSLVESQQSCRPWFRNCAGSSASVRPGPGTGLSPSVVRTSKLSISARSLRSPVLGVGTTSATMQPRRSGGAHLDSTVGVPRDRRSPPRCLPGPA